jgi:glycosyltransferase involved in cell wall biosynthesis
MKVLFLTHPYPNYVPDLLLHGLRKLIGPAAVDFPRKRCLYEGVLGLGVCPPNQLCPGWFPAEDERIDRDDVPHKIRKGFFDYIVSDVRALGQWWASLEQSPTPLAIVDGEDRPAAIRPGPHLVFRRETDGTDGSIPLPMALPEEIFNWIAAYDSLPKRYSIGFLGSAGDDGRKEFIARLAALYPDGLFSASVVPSGQTPFPQGRYGRDAYYRKLQTCRVVLSLPGAGCDTFRFWENAGCNAVHMARRVPIYIPDDFCDGETILRFSDIEDMRPRIDAALNANEVSRELIASGRYHLFRFHLTTSRARYFLDRIVERRSGGAGHGRCRKTLARNFDSECSAPVRTEASPLYLGLVEGNNYGWGVCSRYLIRELSRLTDCRVLSATDGSATNGGLEGCLFQALTGADFFPLFPKARGRRNYGYTFFENELTRHSIENAKTYDLVLVGSSWCRDRLIERGIENCEVLIQGIDPQLYQPRDEEPDAERFIIFSGGKFELRKGQDLVLRAFKVLQDKYPDIWLVNCWYNLWPESLRLMKHSQHIRFEPQDGPWQALMQHTYALNGLDASRIVTCDLMSSELLPELYHRSHIGVFPNRCEGGTNLVLMEYMACGKPVIATNGSGHRDILTKANALLLNDLSEYRVVGADNTLIARWQEPSLDELIARLEWAYQHRKAIRTLGRRAGEDLKGYTWEASARRLLNIIDSPAAIVSN